MRSPAIRRHPAAVARRILAGCLVASLGCAGDADIPTLSFLATTADSAFLVAMDDGAWRIRRSDMLLGRIDDRFVELYVQDDDRSFYDALIVAQRIYRRDLLTGDSIAVHEDTTVAAVAEEFQRRHPEERPLLPDEDTADDPAVVVTTETELLGLAGPFLSFEYHGDIDVGSARGQHITVRRVVDVRSGRLASVADVSDSADAVRVFARAARAFEEARDSVRRTTDVRARRAQAAFGGFAFDSLSFALFEDRTGLSIAFLVPGRGMRAGGLALPLGPIEVRPGSWKSARSAGYPSDHGDREATWRAGAFEIVARLPEQDVETELMVRRGESTWQVGSVAGVVERVHVLTGAGDDSTFQGLSRAFDEARLHSAETRVASLSDVNPRRGAGPAFVRPRVSGAAVLSPSSRDRTRMRRVVHLRQRSAVASLQP
jgi:hypothetical protein